MHSVPGNDNTIVVAFSGFGLANHVWRGTVPATGTATWTAVSGGLPDVPMYALMLASATEWYVGTDIGVFRTTDGGAGWVNYSQGLPNTADLRPAPPRRQQPAARRRPTAAACGRSAPTWPPNRRSTCSCATT